jgi:hypothetical protein
VLILLRGHLDNVNNQSEYRWPQSKSVQSTISKCLDSKIPLECRGIFAKIPPTYFDHPVVKEESILGPYDWSE